MSKEKRTITTRRVIKYVRHITKQQKWNFIFVIIGGISAMIISLVLPIYFAKIIDVISTSQASKGEIVHILFGILVSIALLEIGSIASRRLFGFNIAPFETGSMRRIFNECFEYIHKHSYRFFTNNFSGALVKKMNKLAFSFEDIIDNFSFNILRLIIGLPFIIITIWSRNFTLGMIFLGFIIIFTVLQYIFYKINIPYEIKANIQDSKTTGELADTITNNFNILTFASLNREKERFGKITQERARLTKKKWLRSEWMFFISTILLVTFEIVVIYYCIIFRGQGLVSTGMIILTQTYIFKVFEELFNLRNVLKSLNRALGEAAEMLEILDMPHEIQDKTDMKLGITSGRIEFIDMTFKYTDGRNIFENLNLRIKPGEKVAIVGHSGSGKTTLVKLLFRFFDIQGGEILIDGQNIGQVTQDSLRGSMSIVPQDPILFHRSIKENITYGNPDATQEEIIAAAKMARCHDFIMGLNNGYDTLVGERGIKLSGGERQRVAIARAILENKRIFVLDEATSSLDSESENLIQEAMDEVMKNKTVIVIAHRLSTIMKMDKIIVMDEGKIIEKGSHKELVTNPDGMYKKLRDIQSGGFIE